MTHKTCNACKEKKPVKEFYKDSAKNDGLRSKCKTCVYSPSVSKQASNMRQNKILGEHGIRICATCNVPKKIEEFYEGENRCKLCCVARSSAYNREAKHQWPAVDYELAYAEQEGKCAICSKHFDVLCGDHDHATLQKRALLCNACNFILGLAKDNPDTLDRAAMYLREHSPHEDPLKLLKSGNPYL